MIKLEGTYNPKDFEDELYKEWEEKGYFNGKKKDTLNLVWIKTKSHTV